MNFCQLCTRLFDRADSNSMKFDDFIQCCVLLRSLTESFKRLDTDKDGVIDVSYEQVLDRVYFTDLLPVLPFFFLLL